MGEYAMYNGDHVKIGTCEDMYYLRWDQAHLVSAESGSVDPLADATAVRFRFPFPNEDRIRPGEFEDPFRGIAVPHATVPDGVDHHTVQFSAQRGYLMSVPCPESGETIPYHVHRNGFSGAVKIVQQKWWNGHLITICECGGCGAKYRLEDLAMAEPIAVALRSYGDQRSRQDRASWQATKIDPATMVDPGRFYHLMADRMLDGYNTYAISLDRSGV
jgi:hypothetical protein